MIDMERRLVEIGPVAPPEALDQSVEQMLRWAGSDHRRRSGRRNQALVATVGCVIGLIVGWGIGISRDSQVRSPQSETTKMIVINATPELMRWVVGDGRGENKEFFDREHAGLETVYLAGESKPEEPSSL